MNHRNESADVPAHLSNCFLGYARVDFSLLSFKNSLQQDHREESYKATARLSRVFQLEGCRRLEPANFIDAVIPLQKFQEAVAPADVRIFHETSNVPQLRPECPVECQNGLHRIAAARDHLPFNDRWWIVRLFSQEEFFKRQDLTSYTQASFAHEQKYSDGHIFRCIRLASRDNLYEAERVWWARLTFTKQKNLRQLLRNYRLTEAFDRLLDFSGLWEPIQLGTLHRFHGLRCPEELLNYLKHTLDIWSLIKPLAPHVDSATVRGLELRAPGISKADLREIMQNNEILSSASDSERSEAIEAFKQTDCIIPSLKTFFENLKYLEPCSSILRKLLGACEPKRSLEAGFGARHFEQPFFMIQTSEQHVLNIPIHERGALDRVWERKLGYIQLWMFCLRHFPEMTDISPKLESRRLKAEKLPNRALWYQLGTLAWRLGFDTEEIRRLKDMDPDRVQVRELLQTLRPYHNTDNDVYVDKIVDILNCIEKLSCAVSTGEFTGSERYPMSNRCGRPHYNDHHRDKDKLFLPLFWQDRNAETENIDVTSLFVKRDLLCAFFGKDIIQRRPQPEEFNIVPENMFTRSSTSHFHTFEADNSALSRDLDATRILLDEAKKDCQAAQESLKCLSEENISLKSDLEIMTRTMAQQQETMHELQKSLGNQTLTASNAASSQENRITDLENQLQVSELTVTKLSTDLRARIQDIQRGEELLQEKDREREILLKAKQQTAQELQSIDNKFNEYRRQRSSRTMYRDFIISATGNVPETILAHRPTKIDTWAGNLEWMKRRFAVDADHERRTLATSIFELCNESLEYVSIVHVSIDEGYRAARYWVQAKKAQTILMSIPAELVAGVIRKGTDGFPVFQHITEPITQWDGIRLRSACGTRGICLIGTREVIQEIRKSASRKRNQYDEKISEKEKVPLLG